MKVICSWCTSEGRIGLVCEKAPFADARETHGICVRHLHKLGAARDPLVSSDGDSPFPLHDPAPFLRNLSAVGRRLDSHEGSAWIAALDSMIL